MCIVITNSQAGYLVSLRSLWTDTWLPSQELSTFPRNLNKRFRNWGTSLYEYDWHNFCFIYEVTIIFWFYFVFVVVFGSLTNSLHYVFVVVHAPLHTPTYTYEYILVCLLHLSILLLCLGTVNISTGVILNIFSMHIY